MEIKLPELGENVEAVDVSAVFVNVGDAVRRDQPLIEVETEKASLEVPATADGRVTEVLVRLGERVKVGATIVRVEPAEAEAEAEAEEASEEAEEKEEEKERATAEEEAPARAEAPRRDDASAEDANATAGPRGDRPAPSGVIAFPGPTSRSRPPAAPVPAAPSTRALAREIGVDIREVRGSGPGGRIGADDVKAHARAKAAGRPAAPGAAPELPDLSRWGDVERRPLSALRRAAAAGLATAWATVPHVTQFDHADVTELESMRRRFNERSGPDGPKLTLTALAIRFVAGALRRFPEFNAALDLAGGSVVLRKYVHVGVAVDTERGLLVPVVRDADRKDPLELSRELGELARRARERKLTPDEMQGAGFTISNLGGLGTTYFTPIVPWPQVAILGLGRADTRPVFVEGRFRPRLVLPLSVSYDHRLIDGADAARFLRAIAEAFEQPLLLLLEPR